MSVKPLREKWAGAMSGRERFRRQMGFESFDRSFNMEFGYWQENFQSWGIFRENGVNSIAEADVFLNFDRIETVRGNVWLSPLFPQSVVAETENTRIIMNRDGLLAEVPKDGHSSIPHFMKPTVTTPAGWKKCKAERLGRDLPGRKPDIEGLKVLHPRDRDYPLGVDCGSMIGRIRDMLTFEGLAYACYDYPDMVEDMVETACCLVEDFLDAILPHFSFDFASGWEDIAFKSGPIVSVDFFGDVVVPRYKRINAKLKKYGIGLWYTDCDGDVRPLIPLFIEAGINTMFPFEVNSSGHPGKVLDEYGKDLRIMGGVDKLELGRGREAIKKYLESIAPYVERGGFIPFCDHRCPPNVREDDYLYYLDLKEEMFGAAKN